MKKHILTTLAMATLAAPALAAEPETAVSIDPVFSTTTRTECTTPAAASTGSGWLGPALGGVLGAAVGSQLGSGKGNTIATASGAVLGAQAGGAIAGNGQAQAPARQECRDITERKLNGYSISTERGRRVFVPLHLIREAAQQ